MTARWRIVALVNDDGEPSFTDIRAELVVDTDDAVVIDAIETTAAHTGVILERMPEDES